MLRGFVTAIRTLSILPCPGRDAVRLSDALPWFPLTGFLLGWILFGLVRLLVPDPPSTWPQGMAVILVIGGVLLTRGLHLDGLADWADGFWGGRDRNKVLEIMKDPHTGTFGTAAIVCVLLAKWVCFSELLAADSVAWIVPAYVISRGMMAVLAATQPYARPGDGTAAAFVREARPIHWLLALLLTLLILFVWHGVRHWLWLPALALAWIITRLFGFWCRMRIGGITGDLLGACNEITETGILALGAFAGAWFA